MSGIVGIVNRDGTLVDPRLLARMTDTLGSAGPDAQRVWLEGAVGLGHAWLRTSRDAPPESQPLTLDGEVWIAADARVDDRHELVRALRAHGRDARPEAPDAALILHAYRAWGDACVHRLVGDFAFAIWDRPRRRLLCARDHFGVKPLFYANGPTFVVFSSSLDCVLAHPGVSHVLSDQAIAAFLCGEGPADLEATCYAGVRRLPAAHVLTAAGGPARAARYWRLPVDGEIRYRRGGEYVEHFTELLGRAVADRLRAREVGVLMSGGLDSTTVAATARRCLAAAGAPFDLRAYTTVCERIVADPERRHAQLAADALGIPIHYRIVDDYQVFERWDKPELRRPEPEGDPLLAVHVDQLSDAASRGRVLLTGHGGDPALRLPLGYAVDLVRRGKLLRLAIEAARYVAAARRVPRVRLGVHVARWLWRADAGAEARPAWLAVPSDERIGPAAAAAPIHPTRPHAYELLSSPDWPLIFESYDASVTGVPVEVRHPLFDRRVVEYLLAIPPMPWCFDKTIVRLAMRGVLPDAVRLRPKAVASDDPLVPLMQAPGAAWVDRFEAGPELGRYVDRCRVPRVRGERDAGAIWANVRPLCLDHWLRSHDVA